MLGAGEWTLSTSTEGPLKDKEMCICVCFPFVNKHLGPALNHLEGFHIDR